MIKSDVLKMAVTVTIFLVLTISIFSFASATKESNKIKQSDFEKKLSKFINKDSKKRFIAKNNGESVLATKNGCTLISKNKKFKVFSCDEKTGKKMSLTEDIVIYGDDSDVNNAVSANVVNDLGYTGKGVTIAVLDSGYNYNHPDLASSYVGGYDFINLDNDPMDDQGHGSHVAGIITSDGIDSRSKGIAPDTKIVSIKVLNNFNSGFMSDVVLGIYYAVDNYDIDVISISISGLSTYSNYCDNSDYMSAELTSAIDYAHEHNVNVVVSAGNTGADVTLPACISGSFSVGSTYNDFTLRSLSARGPLVDLYAPGSDVYSTVLGNSYITKSGTSMSTPLVSGAIALLKEKNAELNWNDYENAIVDGALVRTESFGTAKMLNVSGALNLIDEPFVCSNPTLRYSFVDGQFITSWQTEVGCSYNLEETTDLASGNWLSIGIFEGNGSVLSHSMYPDGPMRFFKIEIVN